MENLILIIHVVVSIAVIGLVLIQHGKGADAGAAFGGGDGGSGSLFGVQGSSNFLTRATSICVTVFFCTSIALAFIASSKHHTKSTINIPVNNSEPVNENQDLDDGNSVSQDIPN
mgnify:CR=1 FL=1